RLPAEAPIELAISGNVVVGDPTDISKPEIELDMGPHVEGRTQEPLVIRIMRFRAAECLVRTTWLGTDVKSQFSVAGSQAPPLTAVLCRQLRAVGATGLAVREHDGKGCRVIDLLDAAEVVVIVVEGGHAERQPLAGPTAITELVRQCIFRDKARSAGEKKRGAARSIEVAVDA